MANKKATKAAPKAQTQAQGTDSDETKAPSIGVQAKRMVARIVDELTANGTKLTAFLSKETAEALTALRSEIGTAKERGVPAEDRLKTANAELDAHYATMPKPPARPDADWNTKTQAILNRISRIEREIKEGGASRGKGGKENNAPKA